MIDPLPSQDDDQALAQGLRDEGIGLGRLHSDRLAARVLAARPGAADRPGTGRHGWFGWTFKSGDRIGRWGAAMALTTVAVTGILWLHRPAPAVLPAVDVLSQISLGGL